MTEKILIMGLPGSGKTYFSERLKNYLEIHDTRKNISDSPYVSLNARVDWFNADDVRKKFNDWDFSKEGRIRQSLRMAEFSFSSFFLPIIYHRFVFLQDIFSFKFH